jgi:hypothetical protein
MMAAIILLVMSTVFVFSNSLLTSPDPTPEPTPTETTGPLVASTLTPTPLAPTLTPTTTPTVERATRPVRPTATPEVVTTPTPAVRPPACPNSGVQITSPGVNQVVQGNVQVRGTANLPDFQYYKVEVGPGPNPKDHEWTVVGQLHQSPVVGGVLEILNSSAYPAGSYTLRLVVVDQTGNYPEPCRVTVTVQR